MSAITILRASPLTSIQDKGRLGMLAHGIGPSGPMDRSGFAMAQTVSHQACGAAIEFGPLGIDISYSGPPRTLGLAGGAFAAHINGRPLVWPGAGLIETGNVLTIMPGGAGNFGYVRFDAQLDVPLVLGSRSTNSVVGLGGFEGRQLRAGDILRLQDLTENSLLETMPPVHHDGPIRFIWGIHAELFPSDLRRRFCEAAFKVSASIDRMGFKLTDPAGVFREAALLGLVSDSVTVGDVQILGDGTPIVLMADHQPTGGYPRIATIIDADRDRFAQIRPGQAVRFAPVTVDHAHAIAKARS